MNLRTHAGILINEKVIIEREYNRGKLVEIDMVSIEDPMEF